MARERRPSLIKGENIRCGDHTVVLNKKTKESAGDPTVKITKREGVVHEIEITCGCGSVVRLNCRYTEEEES